MNAILSRLEKNLGENINLGRAVSGGDIAQASILETESGKKYFFKTASKKGLFTKEASGLRELSKAKAFRTPEVIYAADDCLVLEWIDTGMKSEDFFARFGKKFADLHHVRQKEFGFFEDNYIGATLQPNLADSDEKSNWATFFWNKRLKFQFELVVEKGHDTDKLNKGMARLENKIEEILKGSEEAPSLLHGDLWSGNYIVSNLSEPILIDPAVYYGHREADLAMTRLFGGFPSEFYTAYENEYPLQAGADYRLNVYLLYHVLNHLNLFGTSYLSQAERLVWSYL